MNRLGDITEAALTKALPDVVFDRFYIMIGFGFEGFNTPRGRHRQTRVTAHPGIRFSAGGEMGADA